MRHFQLIAKGVDVIPLQHALLRQPELWNANPFRTSYTNTPHVDVDDILIRYSDPSIADPENIEAVQNDHGAVWYPAAEKLAAAKPLIINLMNYLDCYQLDRVVISRIKPGGQILPHADIDGDYVHMKGAARYHIVVQGNPGSMFYCGGEEACMQTGEIWWFDHKAMHSIKNNSNDDRIHLMADMRRWPC